MLMGNVERASMMGVLVTQGGFGLAFFQGWGGGRNNVGKCSSPALAL